MLLWQMLRRIGGRLGAHTGSAGIMPRALATRKLPQAHKSRCRHAAGEPAIHAKRSEPFRAMSQLVDDVAERGYCSVSVALTPPS